MAALKHFPKLLISTYRLSTSKCSNNYFPYVCLNFLQTLNRFCSSKAHCNIATIGHIGHGKTTLISAIRKVLENDGHTKSVSCDQIDKTLEKARSTTKNACHFEYVTARRCYVHTDCPSHIDFIKNMVVGASQMDGAILVVAATDGITPQTKEQIQLAKQIGVRDVVVYVNKADLVDRETLELVKLEVMKLLKEMGYNDTEVPFVFGSAICALKGHNPELGEESIRKLVKVLDERVGLPERQYEGPFVMLINGTFKVGQGTVAMGTVQQGSLNQGDQINILGFGNDIKEFAADLQIFRESVQRTVAGDSVGILLKGKKNKSVEIGMIICAPDPVSRAGSMPAQTTCFIARLYVQKKSEGGRTKPIKSGCNGKMFVDTWSTECHIEWLLEDDKCLKASNTVDEGSIDARLSNENPAISLDSRSNVANKDADSKNSELSVLTVEPGDVTFAKISLKMPMVFREGQRFTVRQKEKTILTGLVTRILTHVNVHEG